MLTEGPTALERGCRSRLVPFDPTLDSRGSFNFSSSSPSCEVKLTVETVQRDTRRRTYNLKEQKLAKAIVTALDLPPDSADARKLINWKVPTKEDVRHAIPPLWPIADPSLGCW
jgi:hypothetical protein